MKNFELTNEIITIHLGVTLHRIRAVKDIVTPRFTVKAGELGGFVEKVDNLDGNAWVSGNAWVYGNAWVCGDARVCGNARIYDDARVYGNSRVYGDARVYGNALVSGNAWVYGNALVSGNAEVSDNAMVCGNARVYGNASIYDDAEVDGNASIYDDAEVFRTNHYLVVGPIGSRDDYTTFFRSKEGAIKVKCGCFRGTTDEFLAKVEKTHGDSKYAKVYRMATEMALAQIDMN